MHSICLIGRDIIRCGKYRFEMGNELKITEVPKNYDTEINSCPDDNETLKINVFTENSSDNLDVNSELDSTVKDIVVQDFREFYVNAERPIKPEVELKMNLCVEKHNAPFFYRPRKISYEDKIELQKLTTDLEERGIIRKSMSQYSFLLC